jgi:hypothetical protein
METNIVAHIFSKSFTNRNICQINCNFCYKYNLINWWHQNSECKAMSDLVILERAGAKKHFKIFKNFNNLKTFKYPKTARILGKNAAPLNPPLP